jgi:hypothetical protein
MGLAMQRTVATYCELHKLKLRVRIGVHTGPAMGGIIGTLRFHFDMWGSACSGAVRTARCHAESAKPHRHRTSIPHHHPCSLDECRMSRVAGEDGGARFS